MAKKCYKKDSEEIMRFSIPGVDKELLLSNYSKKSLVLRCPSDPTYPNQFREYLRKSYFRRSPNLKCGYGWLISKDRKEDAIKALERISSGQINQKKSRKISPLIKPLMTTLRSLLKEEKLGNFTMEKNDEIIVFYLSDPNRGAAGTTVKEFYWR